MPHGTVVAPNPVIPSDCSPVIGPPPPPLEPPTADHDLPVLQSALPITKLSSSGAPADGYASEVVYTDAYNNEKSEALCG